MRFIAFEKDGQKASALDHVAGYSIFNDGSARDFQLRTSQWTRGKHFDLEQARPPADFVWNYDAEA
jgi:2-keto-4-pentenoate hydratase/2-oxohepta-3-ene-1,7-dioic acid hydratase in catechol pathway